METEQQLNEEQAAELRIHELAQQIHGNSKLRKIVKSARFGLRAQVYNEIVPHLNFKPLPFSKLVR